MELRERPRCRCSSPAPAPPGLMAALDPRRARRRVPRRRAPARAAGPARARPCSARARWSSCARWGLEDGRAAAGPEVEWTLLESRDARRRPRRGASCRVGLPTREQARSLSPTAPACVPQDAPRAGARCAAARPRRPRRVGRRGRRRRCGAGGVRATVRDVGRRRARASAPATSSPPTARAARCARALGIRCAGPTSSCAASPRSSARRSGSSSATRRHGIYAVTRRGAEGRSCPPGRATAGPTARSCDPGPSGRSRPARRRSRSGSAAAPASPGLPLRIERTGTFSVARPARRPLPPGERVPRRRRRAPRHAARRHRA